MDRGDVLLACVMGLCASWIMPQVWPLRTAQAKAV